MLLLCTLGQFPTYLEARKRNRKRKRTATAKWGRAAVEVTTAKSKSYILQLVLPGFLFNSGTELLFLYLLMYVQHSSIYHR